MKIYLLMTLFFNYITCIEIKGNFDKNKLLSSYITPRNDILIFNPNNSALLKYKINSKIPFYKKNNYVYLSTEEFPQNISENISDIYFHFNYINSSSINITYFNENYTSYYIYNPNAENKTYDHISLKVINKNILILFLHQKNKESESNSTINIVEFDIKSEEKLKISNSYSFQSSKDTNCYCELANNNSIICGLIEFHSIPISFYSSQKIFIYSLLYFSETTHFQKNISVIYNITHSYDKDPNTGIFNGRFIKIIPLSEGKFFFCFNEDFSSKYIKSSAKIRCSLAQIQNNEIIINSTIYISDPIDINLNGNYIKKNSFDGVKKTIKK